jgi:hypothetical protein
MDPSTSYPFISSCSIGITAGFVCLSKSMLAVIVSGEHTQKRSIALTIFEKED